MFQVKNVAEFPVIIPCLEKLLNNCVTSDYDVTVDECSMIGLWLRKIVHCSDPKRENLYLKALNAGPDCMKELQSSLIPQQVALGTFL